MKKTDKKLIAQIEKLYKQIVADYKDSLYKCMSFWEILTDYKQSVGHGHSLSFF